MSSVCLAVNEMGFRLASICKSAYPTLFLAMYSSLNCHVSWSMILLQIPEYADTFCISGLG